MPTFISSITINEIARLTGYGAHRTKLDEIKMR
jgi:hypothetical protein